MRVYVDKIWVNMCLIPLKAQFYVVLSGKSPPKLALGKISSENFCKLVKSTKMFILLGRVCLLTENLSNTLTTHNYLLIIINISGLESPHFGRMGWVEVVNLY